MLRQMVDEFAEYGQRIEADLVKHVSALSVLELRSFVKTLTGKERIQDGSRKDGIETTGVNVNDSPGASDATGLSISNARSMSLSPVVPSKRAETFKSTY